MSEQLTIADYDKVLDECAMLLRRLDVALNGKEGAALQPSLCDIVGQVEAGLPWRPIAWANQDGTEYIGRLGPKKFRLVWYWKVSSRTEGWCDENGKRVHPTHFMPKPADPHI